MIRLACLVAGLVIGGVSVAAQAPSLDTPALTAAADSSDWIGRHDPARFTLSRALVPGDGRLGVIIGTTDWSPMTEIAGTSVRVSPSRAGFPAGEHAVSLYLVSVTQEWQPIGQAVLRVLTDRGFERATTAPTLEVGLSGQAGLGRTPAVAPSPRDTYQDLTVRAGFDGHYVRHGWTTMGQAQVVGVSFEEQALRYGQLREDAPRVDLGSYRMSASNGIVTLSAGHTSVGTHRLLLNGFASRGLTGSARLGPVVDLSLSAVNGSSLVGYGNILGLGDSEHRVLAAAVGFELLPARRGALRFTGSLMDGSILPVTNVNQGAVRDPEQSRGVGVQVSATDTASRFRLDAGVARSRFVNPRDPFAPPGLAIVEVEATTRTARYLDASYAILQDAPLGSSATASLTAAVRHSRVDPLYRSVALPVRADVEQHAVDVTTALGGFTSQFTFDASRDNLAEVASILTTRTRQVLWTSALPLVTFAGAATEVAAWPTISYSLSRVHQVADGLPVGGLFDSASQAPDQVSLNQTLGVTWQGASWRGGYTFNRSLQDNRQVGRERADLLNVIHAFTVGAAASTYVDASVEVAFEDAENVETVRTDVTRRISGALTLRPTSRTTLSAILTRNRLEDTPRTSTRRTTDVNLSFSQGVSLWRAYPERLNGQFFVRYVRQSIYGLFLGAGTADDTRFWTLNTGLTFRVF